jgi:xylose isomerase
VHRVGEAVDGLHLGEDAELNCKLCDLWWGRDGAEVDAAKDPVEAIKWLREGLNYLQAYIDKQGYKGYRLAIEPKPNEPRGDTYLPTVGHALGLIATLDKPDNCGLVVEIAHSRMAGLNAYHDIAQPLEQGKLFGCHLNAQKPLRFDQDLRFGAEDLKESFFVVKLLEDNGWQGARSFDAHPYRTADREEAWDFAEGCMRTYLILREKVQRFNADPEIQGLLKDLRCEARSEPLPSFDKLKAASFDWDALARRKLHHERLDGKGYPFHLKAEDIPLGSRIMAVADVFTAITEDRPYRKGMSDGNAKAVLRNMVQSGALCPFVENILSENFELLNDLRISAQNRSGAQYRELQSIGI